MAQSGFLCLVWLLSFLVLNANGATIEEPKRIIQKSEFNQKQQQQQFLTTFLSSEERETFEKAINAVEDSQCRQHLNATLQGIQANQHWAIAMYDATVKTPVGIENGVLHQFGHFDQCLSQRQRQESSNDGHDDISATAEIPVRAKYCLANVKFDGLTVYNSVSRNKQSSNQTWAHWGVCVPASCSARNVEIFMEHLLQRQVTIDDDEKMCQLQKSNEMHVSGAMFVYAVIIFFFFLLTIGSSCYHFYLICAPREMEKKSLTKFALEGETLHMALLTFSVIENTKKIFQPSTDHLGLNSINGIKALAMLFILAGHALSFIYGGPVYNLEFMNENIKLTPIALLSNSLLFVDMFLLLSGFLFCRILLVELERRRGQINVLVLYVARYIRLTPAYMAIIGFYMTWFPHVGSGPLWQQRILREQERCQASWWLNILYINNYINTENLCMFQSWYLSVDSQMFFLAPIAIFMLYKSRKQGLRFLTALMVITAVVPFVVTAVKKLDPTLLIFAEEMTDLNTNAYYVGTYIKTHMRASAHIVGLLAGYIVHVMQENGTKLPRSLVRCAWIAGTVVGAASMFAVNHFYVAPSFDVVDSTLYAGLHKIGWNLSVAWLVVAATTGHAGWLERFLSSRFFAPISRLTYCAYLSNGIVELYHSSSVRSAGYMSYPKLTNDVTYHILNTFTLAFVLCLVFESPIHALERILLSKHGRRESGGSGGSDTTEQTDSQTPSSLEEHQEV